MDKAISNNFMLTNQQAFQMTKILPIAYSLQLFVEEEKRIRIPKCHSKFYPQQPPARVKTKAIKKNTPKIEQQQLLTKKQQKINIKQNEGKPISSQIIDLSSPLRNCMRILNKLKKHQSIWPFLEPVDPVALHVPNYLKIVKEPMDIKTIQYKIKNAIYEHPAQFHADMNKIFLNSYKFNPKSTIYYECTLEFEAYYNQLLNDFKESTPINSQKSLNDIKQHKLAQSRVNSSNIQGTKKPQPKIHEERNINQMKNIMKSISNLKSEKLQKILEIVLQGKIPQTQSNFQVDLATLKSDSYSQILKFLNQSKNIVQQIARKTLEKRQK